MTFEWLLDKLKEYDIYDISDAFLVTLDSSGKLFVQKKEKAKVKNK